MAMAWGHLREQIMGGRKRTASGGAPQLRRRTQTVGPLEGYVLEVSLAHLVPLVANHDAFPKPLRNDALETELFLGFQGGAAEGKQRGAVQQIRRRKGDAQENGARFLAS
jgi:hypothetical protein